MILLQRRGRVLADDRPDGRQSEDEAGDEGEPDCPEQHDRMKGRVGEERQLPRAHRQQDAEPEQADRQSSRAAKE